MSLDSYSIRNIEDYVVTTFSEKKKQADSSCKKCHF